MSPARWCGHHLKPFPICLYVFSGGDGKNYRETIEIYDIYFLNSYVYIYIYMCVCVCVCIYLYIYTHTYAATYFSIA